MSKTLPDFPRMGFHRLGYTGFPCPDGLNIE